MRGCEHGALARSVWQLVDAGSLSASDGLGLATPKVCKYNWGADENE